MKSWLKKSLFTRKRNNTKQDLTYSEIVSEQDKSSEHKLIKMPYNQQANERVEKMFARYKGNKLMDEFKTIIVDLREDKDNT